MPGCSLDRATNLFRPISAFGIDAVPSHRRDRLPVNACAQVERDAWVGSCSNNAKVIQIQTSGVGGPQQGQFKALIKSAGGNCDDHDLAKILDKLYV